MNKAVVSVDGRNCAFVRALWGDAKPGTRAAKIWADVSEYQYEHRHRQSMPPCINYVFGNENAAFIERCQLGEVRLLSPDPMPFATAGDMLAWNHKHIAMRAAFDDGLDSIVYMDWDVAAVGLVPIDSEAVFRKLAEKHEFQGCLIQYKKGRHAPWRGRDHNLVPAGAFMYLGSRWVLNSLEEAYRVTTYPGSPGYATLGDDECASAWYTDYIWGGWRGVEHWEKHHEAYCCYLRHKSAVSAACAASKTNLISIFP